MTEINMLKDIGTSIQIHLISWAIFASIVIKLAHNKDMMKTRRKLKKYLGKSPYKRSSGKVKRIFDYFSKYYGYSITAMSWSLIVLYAVKVGFADTSRITQQQLLALVFLFGGLTLTTVLGITEGNKASDRLRK